MLTVYWNAVAPFGTGGAPIIPAATCTFCSCSACTTSCAVRSRAASLVRIEPYPHRIFARAEDIDVAHAIEAREFVANLKQCVIAGEKLVE